MAGNLLPIGGAWAAKRIGARVRANPAIDVEEALL